MTRKEALDKTISVATPLYGNLEARAIAYMLLEECCGITKIDIALGPNEVLDCKGIENNIKEIATGKPIQYIVGKAHFADLEFVVREGVLIPRPETEELIDWIVEDAGDDMEVNILDIGTGSGAIAIVLAKRLEKSNVVALDISNSALEIANSNAIENGVVVDFKNVDILSEEDEWQGEWKNDKYDVIVSNPPYVPVSDKQNMHLNVVGYEPHEALFVDDNDPLVFYRKIGEVAKKLLKPDGLLYFEIYEKYGVEMRELLSGMNYKEIELRKDIHGKERMVRCQMG